MAYTVDLCTGGTPISGGDNSSYVKSNAFDDSTTTYWGSSQLYNSVSGVAYIGYQFASPKTIKQIRIHKRHTSNSRTITSIKIQGSDNGSTWNDVQTSALTATNGVWQDIAITATATYSYWRLLANANLTTSTYYWAVNEIEMMENSPDISIAAPKTEVTTQAVNPFWIGYPLSENLCVAGIPGVGLGVPVGGNASGKQWTNIGNAFDGNKTTYASISPVLDADTVMGMCFPVSVKVELFVVTNYSDYYYTPFQTCFVHSDDGTNWQKCTDTLYLTANTTQSIQRSSLWADGKAHCYWGLQVEGSAGTTEWRLPEIEMYAVAAVHQILNAVVSTGQSESKIPQVTAVDNTFGTIINTQKTPCSTSSISPNIKVGTRNFSTLTNTTLTSLFPQVLGASKLTSIVSTASTQQKIPLLQIETKIEVLKTSGNIINLAPELHIGLTLSPFIFENTQQSFAPSLVCNSILNVLQSNSMAVHKTSVVFVNASVTAFNELIKAESLSYTPVLRCSTTLAAIAIELLITEIIPNIEAIIRLNLTNAYSELKERPAHVALRGKTGTVEIINRNTSVQILRGHSQCR